MKKPMIKALAFATAITMVFSTPLTALADGLGLASLYSSNDSTGNSTGSGPTETGPTGPGSTETGPTGPGSTETGPTDPGTTEPPTGPGTTETGPTDTRPTDTRPNDINGDEPEETMKNRIIGVALENHNLTVTVGEPHEEDVLTASLIMERTTSERDGRIQTITINSANLETYGDVTVLLGDKTTNVTEVLERSITWNSASKKVALTPDEKLGNRQVKVEGKSAGTDYVTVGIEGTEFKDTAKVTVKKYANKISLTAPENPYVKHRIDMNEYLDVPSDTNDLITWKVYEAGKLNKKTSAATISQDGILTLKKADKNIVVVATGERGATGSTPAFTIRKGTPVTKLTKDKIVTDLMITPSKERPEGTLSVLATPADTTDYITWKSSNASVVSVSNVNSRTFNATKEATITALKPGKATITATATSGKKVSFKVTVKAPLEEITDITSERGKTIYAGQKVQLSAVTKPGVCDEMKKIKFKLDPSSDKSIATVSSKGVLQANKKNKPGTVKVIAYYKDKTRTVEFTVKPSLITEITTLNQDSTALFVTNPRATRDMKGEPAVRGEGATPDMLTWTSSKTKVAAVDQNGIVTALSAGKATITASAIDVNGKPLKKTAKIVVRQVATQLVLSKSDVTVNYNNNANKNYTASLKVSKQLLENGKKAKKESIRWKIVSVDGNTDEVAIAASGFDLNEKNTSCKVILPKDVKNGTVVKVRARALYGATATATVTVCNPTQKVVVSNKTLSIKTTNVNGYDLEKAFTVTPKSGYSDKNFNEKIISYTANNGNVNVMRTKDGYAVFGVKPGKSVVTAKTASGKSAKITFTVTED